MWLLINSRGRTEGHLPRVGGEQQRVVCHFHEDEIHILLISSLAAPSYQFSIKIDSNLVKLH